MTVDRNKPVRRSHHGQGPGGGTARLLAFVLAVFPASIVFAINSAVHSCLILAYSDHDKVSMNVGFYYMTNAGGCLAGTVLSGLIYQTYGLEGCLWLSSGFVLAAAMPSFALPSVQSAAGEQKIV